MAEENRTNGPNTVVQAALSTSTSSPRELTPTRKSLPLPIKLSFAIAATGIIGYAAYDELWVSSTLQSRFFTKLNDGAIFTQTVTSPPPAKGNTDVERGYSEIQRIRDNAVAAGDTVSPQLPWKDRQIGPLRLAPIFDRKPQAGLVIRDMNGEKMYQGQAPHRIYNSYDDIPDVIIKSFCAVEDKNICDPNKAPTYNAAINWWRTGQVAVKGAAKKLHLASKVEGGSTLAIQIAKNDSWEKGITRGIKDKAEQMLTASTEMYEDGPDTREQRKQKALEYLNTASFAGHPQFGEIKGVRDAMAILYGNHNFDDVLRSMKDDEETALVFRQMFSLVMSVKMPDESLRTEKGFNALQDRIDNFGTVLQDEKVITPSFAKKVRDARLRYEDIGKTPAIEEKADRDKYVDSMRLAVMGKLNLNAVDGMYKLDRWDVDIDSTLDHAVTAAVTAKMRKFNDPVAAAQMGLTGFQRLRPETVPKAIWAFTLNERLPDGRIVIRVSTDTFKGSLDLTKDGRQNYGSTAKMRMAVTFLEVIAQLHDKLSPKSSDDLKAIKAHPRDRLTRWAIDYLSNPANDHSLLAMQKASISTIKYSGRPQGFFTGGGMNYPQNFDRSEDSKFYTVEEALWESVNVSWYHITDDIEEYMKWGHLALDATILDDEPFTPEQLALRGKYLEEFADYEGIAFSSKFWRQQKRYIAAELASNLARKDDDYAVHMTALYRGFYPEGNFNEYADFMNAFCKSCGDKNKLRQFFDDNKKKSKSSAASLLAAHTDGSLRSLMTLFRYTAPKATYEQAKAFILSLDKDKNTPPREDAELSREFNDYKSPVPQAVLDLLIGKAKGAKTKLAVIYTTLYPDASFEDFESFMKKECQTCGAKDDLQDLYNQHKPERQIDILSIIVRNPKFLPENIIPLYKHTHPYAFQQDIADFIAKNRPEIMPFQHLLSALDASSSQKPSSFAPEDMLSYTDRSPEQLSALYGLLKPGTTADDMKDFVQRTMENKKLHPDYKMLHTKYGAAQYNPSALFYKFDLNDRGYLTRPIHPLELAIAAERFEKPDITWKEAIENTRSDRIHVYKWLIHSNKKKAQDKAIGIMIDQQAWREIGKQWKSVGYPFKLVSSLGTVIGVSGDTTEALATLNSIFLSGGMKVATTRISDIHLGVNTPHETHIKLGQPKSEQVIRPTTAQLMLDMTRGVVSSDHGTGRNLKDGFKLSDGRLLDVRGKTGTNDESLTSGVRVAVFAGTISDRYSFCLSSYITNASAQDKFTSGTSVQGLKMLFPELKSLFERSYGIAPQLINTKRPPAIIVKLPEQPASANSLIADPNQSNNKIIEFPIPSTTKDGQPPKVPFNSSALKADQTRRPHLNFDAQTGLNADLQGLIPQVFNLDRL